MNNSRLIFKNLNGNENDLIYSLNASNDCVQIECDTNKSDSSLSSVNILKPPPVFHLPAPPDPLSLLSLNDLHSLGLFSSSASMVSKTKNPENFLLHLLNAPNKLEQCVDLRLQMTALGLKKHDSTKTPTGFNNNNNIKQINNRLRTTTNSLDSTSTFSIQSPINSSTNNMLNFVLLSFMSLFCLLLILVLIYFLIQRKKMQKNALNQHNVSLSNPHNQFEPLEHLYHQHHTLKKDSNTLERNQSNQLNQIQHYLLKQQMQNDLNINRQQQYVTSNNCSIPVSTSLLTFDWLPVANKHQNLSNNQSVYNPDIDNLNTKQKKKLIKKYSDTSRKSNSINQQTEMKLLQQPLLDTAAVANSTLSTRATVTASSSSSSSSSVSSSIHKNESVNHYQKLYPRMMNQATDNFLNYSLAASNDVNSAYNNLLVQNLYNGTLLNNKPNVGYNKVALLCNTNDPNAPQLIKIMNLNPEVNCDCIQMINLDPNLNHSHLLFETNHYENYRNLPNNNNTTNKRFSQTIDTNKTNVDTNPEQFYELIDDNILSSNLTSNNYCEWTDKNKSNLIRRNSNNLTSSFNTNTKRKYPKTNPNYSQSNYITIKNNSSS